MQERTYQVEAIIFILLMVLSLLPPFPILTQEKEGEVARMKGNRAKARKKALERKIHTQVHADEG